jgi:hypothetical protein
MTRDEAVKLTQDTRDNPAGTWKNASEWEVDKLVALGLLKLDEPRALPRGPIVVRRWSDPRTRGGTPYQLSTSDIEDVAVAFEAHGYKIIPI